MTEPIHSLAGLVTGVDLALAAAVLIYVPALLLAHRADARWEREVAHFAQIPSWCGLTGFQAAVRLLKHAGLAQVDVIPLNESLKEDENEHLKRQVVLPNNVRASRSVNALAVAAQQVAYAGRCRSAGVLAGVNAASKRFAPYCLAGSLVLIAYGVLEGPLVCIVWSAVPFAAGLTYFGWEAVMHYRARPHALKLLREAGLVRPEELD